MTSKFRSRGSRTRSRSTISIPRSLIRRRCDAMGSLVSIKLPDIGEFEDVEVIEVMVKPGDKVNVDDSLITIESDKASMEVPATEAGIVKELKVKVGDRVSEGSPIIVVETSDDAAEAAKPAQATAPSTPPRAPSAPPKLESVPPKVVSAPPPAESS